MQLPNTLTEEQSVAIIACLRILAAHGRAIRLANEQQKDIPAEMLGSDAADMSETANGTNISMKEVCTDVPQ